MGKWQYRYIDPFLIKLINYILGMDYKNPLHLDVVDRYLRLMGNKMIPD